MAASKVYFTTFHTTLEENIQQKLSRLLLTAGMDQIDFRNRYVAIKMHFGEPGNLAYLRPNYAKTVADLVRQLGGKPFLTDCNTLYVGGRKNALDHIESAYVNGFTPYTTGCHIIIADGLKGSDDVAVPVDGEYVKNARIGRALMDADIVISLTHFKGHEATGIGGTIKNLGMGGGSRAGKKEMHADGKPAVNESKCIGCGACRKICAHDAPTIENRKMHIDTNKCVGCGRCIAVCPMDAIEGVYDPDGHLLNCKMAEYAKAVVQGARASTSALPWISRRTATATPRTTCLSSRMSACLPRSTPSRWTRPAPKCAAACRATRTPPSRMPPPTTCSMPSIP